MLNDYGFKGPTKKIEIEVEIEIAEKLSKMEKHKKLSQGEIVNTALKRFISQHSDFLPSNDSVRK